MPPAANYGFSESSSPPETCGPVRAARTAEDQYVTVTVTVSVYVAATGVVCAGTRPYTL
jgi:hypothetical protein